MSDRKDHKDYEAMLRFASKRFKISRERQWAAVVDFCAFKWRDIQCVSHALEGLVRQYIFISSDSVYNNFTRRHGTGITEEMFDLEEWYRKGLKKEKDYDSYGYVSVH